MKKSFLQNTVLILLGIFVVGNIVIGVGKIWKIHSMLDKSSIRHNNKAGKQSLQLGTLQLTIFPVSGADSSSRQTVVSVLNFNHQVSLLREKAILRKASTKMPVFGLKGHPSFILTGSHLSFWKLQLYFEVIFMYGGLALIFLLLFFQHKIEYESTSRFIKPLRNITFGFALLFMGGALIKWAFNVYLLKFLTNHYHFSQAHAPFPFAWFCVGVVIFVLAIKLIFAVRLQKEQDLTI